ncbi:hypothetical protein FOA52_013051 [Chlamydomonas sp. UWO 241]|nr:hypothetical protein FOA52_013051 [Chlamydomonas sp. UWO 241]
MAKERNCGGEVLVEEVEASQLLKGKRRARLSTQHVLHAPPAKRTRTDEEGAPEEAAGGAPGTSAPPGIFRGVGKWLRGRRGG